MNILVLVYLPSDEHDRLGISRSNITVGRLSSAEDVDVCDLVLACNAPDTAYAVQMEGIDLLLLLYGVCFQGSTALEECSQDAGVVH